MYLIVHLIIDPSLAFSKNIICVLYIITIIYNRYFKIEYHAVGDTWWQPLLSYGKWCTELLKIGWFIY